MLDFFHTPTISLPVTLYCFNEYYPSKPQLWRNLLFLTTFCHLPISPFFSTPSAIFFPILALHHFLFLTLSSSPLHMWISFSLIIMILGSASVAGPLKPGRKCSSSSNAPFFSSELKQLHKMASTFHTTSFKQLLRCSCPGLLSRNSVVHQRCGHRHAE